MGSGKWIFSVLDLFLTEGRLLIIARDGNSHLGSLVVHIQRERMTDLKMKSMAEKDPSNPIVPRKRNECHGGPGMWHATAIWLMILTTTYNPK
jgi:hypothetical protein